MAEEYLQLSNIAQCLQHARFYGRCAIDVLEVHPDSIPRHMSAAL